MAPYNCRYQIDSINVSLFKHNAETLMGGSPKITITITFGDSGVLERCGTVWGQKRWDYSPFLKGNHLKRGIYIVLNFGFSINFKKIEIDIVSTLPLPKRIILFVSSFLLKDFVHFYLKIFF